MDNIDFTRTLYLTFKAFLLPPGLFCLLLLIALLVWNRGGKKWVLYSLFLLYLFSMPITSYFMMRSLEQYQSIQIQDIKQSDAQAILILSSGRRAKAIEYQSQDIPSPLYFERLRYGVWLHKKTKLPLFITGGLKKPALSQLGKQWLVNEWHIPVKGIETKSKTTWENALFSERMLKRYKIQSIVLVTHAWHLPRAMTAFKQTKLKVLPAGTGYFSPYTFEGMDLLPNMFALHENYYALHEWLGRFWYWLKSINHR